MVVAMPEAHTAVEQQQQQQQQQQQAKKRIYLRGRQRERRERKSAQPVLVSLGAHSLSVTTLVVVSDRVDIWVALKVFISLIYHFI